MYLLHLIRLYPSLPVPVKKLQRLARFLYTSEHIPLFRSISVVLCSDHTIRRLNARYRKIDLATDVLSFAIGDQDLLGEIFISLQRAAIQARRYHVTYREEVLRLFIHGFYHLLGFDHKTKSDRLRMERKEKQALLIM